MVVFSLVTRLNEWLDTLASLLAPTYWFSMLGQVASQSPHKVLWLFVREQRNWWKPATDGAECSTEQRNLSAFDWIQTKKNRISLAKRGRWMSTRFVYTGESFSYMNIYTKWVFLTKADADVLQKKILWCLWQFQTKIFLTHGLSLDLVAVKRL